MALQSRPSNLELQVLSVLWHHGPSTVTVVMEEIPDGRERAYTTLLSVLQSLERKKLVKRERAGRAHVYDASHLQKQVVLNVSQDFVMNAFGGRLGEAVLALLSTGNLTPDEKTRVEQELQDHKAMAAKKSVKKTARKSLPKKVAKKSTAKKAAKKATKKTAVKKMTKKAVKKSAKKSPAKKAAKKTSVRKVGKKTAKKVSKKTAKKAGKKVAKKAGKKIAKKSVKKAAKKAPKKPTKKRSKK